MITVQYLPKEEKESRITRLKRLYKQCLQDKLYHKVAQAQYLLKQAQTQRIERAKHKLDKEYTYLAIKNLYLSKVKS